MVVNEKQNAATYKPWTPVEEVAGAHAQLGCSVQGNCAPLLPPRLHNELMEPEWDSIQSPLQLFLKCQSSCSSHHLPFSGFHFSAVNFSFFMAELQEWERHCPLQLHRALQCLCIFGIKEFGNKILTCGGIWKSTYSTFHLVSLPTHLGLMTIYILPHRSSESAHYLRAAYPTLPGTEAAEETGMGLHARTQT